MEASPAQIRSELVEKYAGYAQSIARELAPKLPIELDDAISVAYVGLVEASQRIDLERSAQGVIDGLGTLETNFKSLAYMRIRGAIYDEVRKMAFVKRRGYEKGLRFDMVSLDKTGQPALELPVQLHMDTEYEDALSTLDPREQFIVRGMAAGYSGQELSQVLEVTPSRVSQLNRRAKDKLTAYLAT